MAMRFEDRELTIKQLVHEASGEPNQRRRHQIFTAWRSKLEKGPNFLPLHTIDEIMREANRRLRSTSR